MWGVMWGGQGIYDQRRYRREKCEKENYSEYIHYTCSCFSLILLISFQCCTTARDGCICD